jgi:hypothetical protein
MSLIFGSFACLALKEGNRHVAGAGGDSIRAKRQASLHQLFAALHTLLKGP